MPLFRARLVPPVVAVGCLMLTIGEMAGANTSLHVPTCRSLPTPDETRLAGVGERHTAHGVQRRFRLLGSIAEYQPGATSLVDQGRVLCDILHGDCVERANVTIQKPFHDGRPW